MGSLNVNFSLGSFMWGTHSNEMNTVSELQAVSIYCCFNSVPNKSVHALVNFPRHAAKAMVCQHF